jgi:hypothetical protein
MKPLLLGIVIYFISFGLDIPYELGRLGWSLGVAHSESRASARQPFEPDLDNPSGGKRQASKGMVFLSV